MVDCHQRPISRAAKVRQVYEGNDEGDKNSPFSKLFGIWIVRQVLYVSTGYGQLSRSNGSGYLTRSASDSYSIEKSQLNNKSVVD